MEDYGYIESKHHFGELHSREELFLTPELHSAVYGQTPDWFWRVRLETDPAYIDTQRLGDDKGFGFNLNDMFELDEENEIRLLNPWLNMKHFHNTFEFTLQETGFGDYYAGALDDLRKLKELRALAEAEAKIEIGNVLDLSIANKRLAERRGQLEFMRQEIIDENNDNKEFKQALLLHDIVDERLLFKSLKLEEGPFEFVADDRSVVPLSALSSGEKHLLFLYYRLIFGDAQLPYRIRSDTETGFHNIIPNTLVMIDEPELSMNVVWQRNFLKDLQRIIELRKFDVLIATHSPEVIYDKWDWTVALGERADD